MTLQFRSRIKSVVDYSSDLKANGVCCEHNTSPNRPDGVAEYISYLSTASQCYSDQNDGSYVTRTFYPGVQSASGFDCLKANQPGCCCSCSYARQSENYNNFLNNIELPVDYVDSTTEKKRCDANEYDLEIALNPEVGMRNNVSQCECNRIGGKWTEGACPTLDTNQPTDSETYSYNWYYDNGSWKSRNDTGPNSKTQVIRQQCYKNETLSVKIIDEGGGPDDQLGTCCLGPTEYNDYGCYFEVVTATKCQEIACDDSYHGLGNGTCVAYQWFSCGTENIRDCPRCWNNDPINGWCCPGPSVEPEKYSQEISCSFTNQVDNGNYVNYEVNFDGTTYTKTGSLDVTCPIGFKFVENGSCSNCTIKGLCCNKNSQICHGWITENECENLVPAEGDRTWNSSQECVQCSPVCCSFPLGRCCYEDRDIQSSTYGETICKANLYKSECETPISQEGLYQGSWSLGDCLGDPCGVGLCCNYESNDCNGGRTEEQCCVPYGGCNETTRVKFLPDNSGTDCGTTVCRFDKGICCSTNYDGSGNAINYCHGYITSAECDFIESTKLYAQTTWDDYYTDCNSGCPNWVNEDTGICCQDGVNPIYSGLYTPDGSYETCVPGGKITERQCLYAQGDADPDADLILNRKWYADAEDCATCTTQQRGRCCNYCNNTCQADVTQSQCCGADGLLCAGSAETARTNANANCSSGGAGTKTWTANNTDCNGCDFLGRCCFMRVDTITKELKPQCTTGNTKTNCDNLQGIWNSNNTCDNNPCQWGMCCGIDESYGKGCIVTTATTCSSGSHTWSASTNINTLVMTYQDGTPPAYTWPGTNKGAIESTRKCLYANPPLTGHIYKVSDLFNHTNLTVSECDFCNKKCNYTGTACQYIDCSGGTCTDTTQTCQCATGINYNNYIAGLSTAALANCATWYGNKSTQCTCTYSGCQTCNTSSPTFTLNSPGEVGEGHPITVTLTVSNYNPSLPSKTLSYIVEPTLGGFSFINDINVAGSSAQKGFINTLTNSTSWSISSTFNVKEDFSSSEGPEIFRYNLYWPELSGWTPKQVDTIINDTSLAPEFFLTFNPPLNNNSIGEKGFKDGLPTGITATTAILRVKNVPAGITYVWTIDPDQGGSFSDFIGIGYSGGLTLGSVTDPSGGFTAGLGLTAFADQITEDQESIILNIKSKNGNIETTATIFIRDESLTPEYAVVAPDQLEEGGNYSSFDIITKYVDPGTTLIWQIEGSGITASDFEFFPGQTGEAYYGTGLTGVIQIGGTYNNGSLYTRNSTSGGLSDGPWLIRAKIDEIEFPDEGFTFAVYSSGASLQANMPLAKKSSILIIEPTSFQLDIINYNLYPSGSKNETIGITTGLTEGYESYYFRLLTKNISSGTTFPFRIVAPGITLYGLTGYANSGSEKLNGWNSIQGYTGMFTVGDVSGVTGVDYLRFKLNYNQFDDEGKTLSFYLLPETNLGASGATSGVYVVNQPSQFSLANTPSIQLTMDPSSGEIAESLSGGRLNGITFTLFTRGIGTSTSGNAMAVIGSSGPSIVNALLTPGPGISYNDFNLIRLGFNTASGATGITFIGGFLNSGWTSGYNFSFIIGNKDTNLGHTATVFLGISGDGITDLSPCFGPTYEGFTFALSSGQSVTREFYHNNFNIPGSTYNVKIYETSYEEPICVITAYKFIDGNWINANGVVKEGDRLKFVLTATKVCPNSKFKVLIEADGSPLSNFNSDDIDFSSSDTNFNIGQFEGTQEFNFVMQNGTYPDQIESAPIFMKLKNNDSFTEGTEFFKISRWSKDWQYYENNPYTNPNYVLSLRLDDTAAPDPTGTCCNPETTPFCQLTTEFNCKNPSGAKYALGNQWTSGNKCPLQSECAGYANTLYATVNTSAQSIILALQEQGYDVSLINPSLPVTTCTACCGFKSTRCCNFSTGIESSGCDATIIKGTYPCPSGSVPIGSTDDCYKRVVCCNNFNNTCRVTSESDCTGIFETPKPYVSGTCSDCDFDNDDPSCEYTVYGSKSNPETNPNRQFQYWNPPSNSISLSQIEQQAIVNISSWGSPNPPKNSLEYVCSIDICCRGDGSGCSRVRYTWQNVAGTYVKTPSISCTGLGDTLLSTQNKDFDLANLDACASYAADSWPDNAGAYLTLKPYIPWDASDFNFGVCCGLSGEEYACKGSVTTRDWCLNQTPPLKYYRWIASAKECSQVKKIVNSQIQDYTIPKYDCEVCAEVKSQQYFYPGFVKAYGTSTDITSKIPRDWNPGTLHKDIVVPACEDCEYTPSTPTSGGGGLLTTFKEYFKNIPSGQGSGAYAAKTWMNYYSLPENIVASISYDGSNWEEFCCDSFKNLYPIRSNFNTLTVSATTCKCSNAKCACKYTQENFCGNINYDECDEGPNNQYGICCNGNNCSIVLDYQCDPPSTFVKCADLPTSSSCTCSDNPCATGRCCTGTPPNATCSENVKKLSCSGTWSAGNCSGNPCNPNPPSPEGLCCQDGVCSKTTQSNCPTSGGATTTFTPCTSITGACECNSQTGFCSGTQRKVCCQNGNCSFVARSECQGTVNESATSCSQQPAPCQVALPTGACCVTTSGGVGTSECTTCTITTQAACQGDYKGNDTTCALCPESACCCKFNGNVCTCISITVAGPAAAACAASGGTYYPNGCGNCNGTSGCNTG